MRYLRQMSHHDMGDHLFILAQCSLWESRVEKLCVTQRDGERERRPEDDVV